MRVRSSSHFAFLGAVLATLAVTTPTLGNGRFPATNAIALSPADPSTILVRATYGFVLTKNGGQRWSWICEAAVGFCGPEDPMVSFTSDGTLLAGMLEGLSVSHDSGCQWDFATGGLENRFVVDLSVDKVDPKARTTRARRPTTHSFGKRRTTPSRGLRLAAICHSSSSGSPSTPRPRTRAAST
jgi:hypothetical protein